MRSASSKTIALVCFSCAPGRGSEPGAGYEFARAACSAFATRQTPDHRVIVLTRRDQAEVLRATFSEQFGNAPIEVVTEPAWLHRAFSARANRQYYLLWSLVVGLSLRRRRPEVVHHVTYASEFLPPIVLLLAKGARRIWGPIGSSQARATDPRGRVLQSVRTALRALNAHLWIRSLDTMIVQSVEVARCYEGTTHVIVEPNVAISDELLDLSEKATRRSFDRQIVVVGLLTHRKRPALALHTLSRMSAKDAGLVLIGDGPERLALESLADDLGIRHRVSFLGQVPRSEVVQHLLGSDVMLHCSVREGAPWAVGEGLTLGLPLVTVEGAGADDLLRITEGLGSIVATDSKHIDLATGLAAAIDVTLTDRLPHRATRRLLAARLPAFLNDLYI